MNSLFQNCGVYEVLVGKGYREVHMVFSIIRVYIDRATGFQNDATVTGIHRLYTDMTSKALSQNYS